MSNYWDQKILIIRFTIQLISVFCYTFCIALIFKRRLCGLISIQLFAVLAFMQLVFVFIPQLLVPFIAQGTDVTSYEYLGSELCKVQGVFMLIGWLGSSAFSVWMSYLILRVLRGKTKDYCLFTAFVVTILTIIAIMLSIALAGQGFVAFKWHYKLEPIYVFCSCQSDSYLILEWILQLFMLSLWLYLRFRINLKRKELDEQGLDSQEILIEIQMFGGTQVILWTINLLVKWMELGYPNENPNEPEAQQVLNTTSFIDFIGQSTILNIFWQIVNLIYDTEGFIAAIIFLSQFRSYFEETVPRSIYCIVDGCAYLLPCCLKRKKLATSLVYSESANEDSLIQSENVNSRN